MKTGQGILSVVNKYQKKSQQNKNLSTQESNVSQNNQRISQIYESDKIVQNSSRLDQFNTQRSQFQLLNSKSSMGPPISKIKDNSRKTQVQLIEEYYQQVQELKKYEQDYKELIKNVQDTYEEINDEINSGDNEEIKLFHKGSFDIQKDGKSPKLLLKIISQLFKVYSKVSYETSNLIEKAKIKINDTDGIQDYIYLLQQAEAENRQNIREKQQLKLSLEAYKEKLKNSEQQNKLLAEYSQNEMEELLKEYYKKLDLLKQNEGEIHGLNEMIKKQKKSNESLEERCLSIIILENKCKKLGLKNLDDLMRQKQEFNSEQEIINKQTRETMRKDRTILEQKNQHLQNQIQSLSQMNKSLKSENTNRIQQLQDIIEEKEENMQRIVDKLQNAELKLAERNKELYLIKNAKVDYGDPKIKYDPIVKTKKQLNY